jgi:hypothetical protein
MTPTSASADPDTRLDTTPAEAPAAPPPPAAEPPLIARQRTALRELARLGAEHVRTGPEIERSYRARTEAADREFEQDYQTAIVRFASSKEAADIAYQERREAVQARADDERSAAEAEVNATRRRALAVYERNKHEAKATYREAAWTASAMLDGAKSDAETEYQEVQQRVHGLMGQLRALHREALELLERWGQRPEEVEATVDTQPAEGKFRRLPDCVATAQRRLEKLRALVVPRFSKGYRLLWLAVLLALLLGYPAALLGGWQFGTPMGWVYGPAISTAVALLAGVIVTLVLKSMARRQVVETYEPLRRAVADAEASHQHILEHYAARRSRQVTEAKDKHRTEMRRLQAEYKARRANGTLQRTQGLRLARDHFDRRARENDRSRTEEHRQAEEHHQLRRASIQERWETESRETEERHRRLVTEIGARYAQDKKALTESWEQALARARAAVHEVNEEAARLFPAWDDPAWSAWSPPQALPPAVRLGEIRVSLEQLTGAEAAAEPGPAADLAHFILPALVAFPEHCSLLLHASDAGRNLAVQALQAVMFRLLTTIPPGKVRFTILDPVGLGQNFAAFMHLADHDEALVASRIWTEQGHIEQRLADMTAHMENVIQKYLRNQFKSIEEYNAHAGEVAEPFRVVVVANFPANFTAEAARRLVSIAQSGPRCGVHVLISVDTKQPMPQGFHLADLEQAAVNFLWTTPPAPDANGATPAPRFEWRDPDFAPFPLRLDEPPPDEFAIRILKAVGERARLAKRVEVPFEFISPPAEQWWTVDSRSGIDVPLGRAGATKRQYLRLGHGTSQHVLIAGKTGSGKSTLLHALITNLALLYAPDELELYLVDFKKGVEFKTYAANELPQARVVAVESEREFGLSVLQRLDVELKHRGDLFRGVGAQNLASYRDDTGKKLPRILLIVDEFQEFFVEDDRIGQDAAQLLDRLVRQGRAFGLHVLLGSQTLGGAYTLARSTIDQMAVRIALQCSEADAHLILSDGNSAARLLSRPGEAIYNDANGLVEGNNPFQVVWLDDDRRDNYLAETRALLQKRHVAAGPPPLVFEGNVAADPGKNHLLNELLQAPTWPAVPPRALQAWLGEPMSIKEPTAAVFRPQSACNMLIVGQQDAEALATLVMSLVSFAAQTPPPAEPAFFVVDGSPVDASYAGYLAQVKEALPHPMRLAGWRDLPALFDDLSAELERRQKTTDTQFAPLFLVLFGLQRFRDLRRAEDDFGFGRREEKPAPAQQFATLLREGAALGVHVLVWCDTLNNLNRSLDRQGMREFDLRVLFQMSVNDSSNLMDTPLAAKLGLHRAYFYSEEQGRAEKFRPYSLPPEAWLTQVGEQLRGKSAAPAQ